MGKQASMFYDRGASRKRGNGNMRGMRLNSLSHDLVVDQLLQLLLAQVILVFVEVEEFLWDRAGCWFILWVVVWLEVWVLKGLVDCDTLNGVER